MGWFRRQRDEPEDVASDSAAVDEPEPAPFVAPRENRPSAGDWMAMPPMARTVGPAPSRLTNVQRISDMMTTRRPLALTGTLGHRVSPLAPAGSVEGLATAIDRPHEVDSGGGDLTLRAPAVPAVQREVGVTTTAAPLSSLPSITEARLPQPPPARALHEPLPLPGRDVGADNPPRPLAVVQRQAAAAPAAAPAPAAPLAPATFAPSPHTDAPDAPDAPVGAPLRPVSEPISYGDDDADAPAGLQTGDGTVVDLPLAAAAPPTTSPSIPMDVMPPIQPRAIQRRAAEAAGASARPETAADAPLPPLPDWARPAPSKAEDTGAATPAVPPAAPQPSAPSTPSMPLQHPTVQREAAPAAAHHPGDGHDHSHDDETEPEAQPAAISREAAPSATGATPSSAPTASDEEERETSAPLAGDAAPIAAATPSALDAATNVETADAPEDAPAIDLPLHAAAPSAPAAAAATLPVEDDGPPPNTWNAPSERLPSDRAPEPEPEPVPTPAPAPVDDEQQPAIQRMADDSSPASTATASTADTSADTSSAADNTMAPLLGDRPLPLHAAAEAFGRAGGDISPPARPEAAGEALPLAPDGSSTGGPTLATPPSAPSAATPSAPNASHAPSTPSAPSAAPAVQRSLPSAPSASGRPSAPVPVLATPKPTYGAERHQKADAPGSSVTAQREPLAGGARPSPPTNAAGVAALPLRALPSVPERPAASPGTGGPLAEPLPVTPPAGAPPIPSMDAPLAFHAVPSMAATVGDTATATATLPDLASAAMPVQTQRAPGAPAVTAHAAPMQSPMPLQAPVVQRSAADTSAAATASNGSAMHASGASPSIGDLAIASGLGVRQPDGSVLFTRQEPPPGANGNGIPASIQRELSTAAPVMDDTPGPSTDRDGKPLDKGPAATMPDLDLLARRLLPRFRRLLATEARTGRGRLGESPWNRH